MDGGNLENVSYDCSFKYVGNKCNFKIIFFNCEAIRLESRMPDNPFFAEYVIGIYNFLEIESSLLESIQDLNFRLGIQAKDWSEIDVQFFSISGFEKSLLTFWLK